MLRQPDPESWEQQSAGPDLEAARARLQGTIHPTPVLGSPFFAKESAAGEVLLKCENLQRTGSFKLRGALNALSALTERDPAVREVLTFSSGNHAQALALAGSLRGIAITIVMPSDAPRTKRRAAEGYGANIVEYDRAKTTREELAAQIASERGLPVIPPFDHPDVIAGQGTAGLELFAEAGQLDDLLVPVGGGGLISGMAMAASRLCPGCRVIGVEPLNADDATRSFRTGTLQHVHNPETVADGARSPSLGEHTFPLVRSLVHDMITVTEQQIVQAMFLVMERMNLVVEPTGALGVAGLLAAGPDHFARRRVGIVISGGNVDMESLPTLLAMR